VGSGRFVSALATGLAGLAVVAAAAPASGQQASPAAARPHDALLTSAGTPGAFQTGAHSVPVVPASAKALGQLPGSSSLRLIVTLKVRNPAALTSFIAALSDRQSPLFRHYLRPGQFGARFGATPAQVATVEGALRSAGLVPGRLSGNRLSIPVRASAAAAEHAFGTTLTRYRLAGGRLAYANSAAVHVPAAAAPYVIGVLGLDTVEVLHSLAIRPAAPRGRIRPAAGPRLAPSAAGPKPCTAATRAATANGSFTADELASYYGMSPLYGMNDLGQGVHVALAEFEDNSASDIAAFQSCYGLHTTVNYIPVDGGPPSGFGSGEAALDIEDVAGFAPDATIDVYQEPNGGQTDVYDLYRAIVDADADQVVSTSWGDCEADETSGFMYSEQPLFEQAATQGQTVLAAAGDDGSVGCGSGGFDVDDPASQPWVIGVGGTSVGASGETVWNDSDTFAGAGGGGISSTWCMPSYQDQTAIPGLISAYSNRELCPPEQYGRQVPDVSADADPYTGYTIYYGGAWNAAGGTSVAAPLWAAVAALTDASPFCHDYDSGNAGVQPIGLYAVAAEAERYIYDTGEALHDITSGNNDYLPTGYFGGLYPATRGYDMASGLGTPRASGYDLATSDRATGDPSTFYPGLSALMCFFYGAKSATTASITKIMPAGGPLKGGNTVTITGTGFLPISGADEARIGSTVVRASCRNSTTCRVRMPGHGTGTVKIQITVEDGLEVTPATSKARYEYAPPAQISSLSPRSGPARGGTRVTIRGRHFVGTVVVHFGRRTARIVSRSATMLVVVAPRGSGTVTVTVSAAGGTSAPNPASRYRY
jgi:subtilase family serine protease